MVIRLRSCIISSTPPPLPYYIWVGLASVGNDTVKHAAGYLSYTARVPFCFGGRSQLVVELDQSCEVNSLYSAQVGMVVLRSVYGKAPKRQLHSAPIAVSGSDYTGN